MAPDSRQARRKSSPRLRTPRRRSPWRLAPRLRERGAQSQGSPGLDPRVGPDAAVPMRRAEGRRLSLLTCVTPRARCRAWTVAVGMTRSSSESGRPPFHRSSPCRWSLRAARNACPQQRCAILQRSPGTPSSGQLQRKRPFSSKEFRLRWPATWTSSLAQSAALAVRSREPQTHTDRRSDKGQRAPVTCSMVSTPCCFRHPFARVLRRCWRAPFAVERLYFLPAIHASMASGTAGTRPGSTAGCCDWEGASTRRLAATGRSHSDTSSAAAAVARPVARVRGSAGAAAADGAVDAAGAGAIGVAAAAVAAARTRPTSRAMASATRGSERSRAGTGGLSTAVWVVAMGHHSW